MTPITITSQWRGEIHAAASTCGQWAYQRTRGQRWAVTHVPTGRRYWTADLDGARTQTADGTAAAFLDTGDPVPDGKPLTRGEHMAVTLELGAAHMRDMLAAVTAQHGEVVAMARVSARVEPHIPVDQMPVWTVTAVLGFVYGRAPWVWLDALRAVRPDLVPDRHRRPILDVEAAQVQVAAARLRERGHVAALRGSWEALRRPVRRGETPS